MGIPTLSLPPGTKSSYVLGQLEGECIEILGGHAVLRVLVSGNESDGEFAVYSAAAAASDACSFSPQPEAYNALIVTKGYLRVLVGERCRDMYPGDFVFIPPNTRYSFQALAPWSEFLSLTTPGNLIDFFRETGKEFNGIVMPEINADTPLTIPSAGADDFSLELAPPLEASDWLDTETDIPTSEEPYFLRADRGPCWAFGGVMSRPLIKAAQTNGKFSVTVMESSSSYHIRPFFDRYISFTRVYHCMVMIEGHIRMKFEGDAEWTSIRAGETLVVSARQFFTVDIASKFVRMVIFTNGTGMDELINRAGYECKTSVLPNKVGNWDGWDEARLKSACAEVGAQIV